MSPAPFPPDEPSITSFQEKVYHACLEIPEGFVITYKDLAHSIGCGSPRAVGQALKRNPFAPDIPCHRVVASKLTIGGFAGQSNGPEVERKRRLLVAEGITFLSDGRINPEHQFSPQAKANS